MSKYKVIQGIVIDMDKTVYEGDTVEFDELPSFLLGKVELIKEAKKESKKSAPTKPTKTTNRVA